MPRLCLFIVCVSGWLATQSPLLGQATQAAADIGAERGGVPTDTLRLYRDRTISFISGLAAARDLAVLDARPDLTNFTQALRQAVAAAQRVRALDVGDPGLEAGIREFDTAMLNLRTIIGQRGDVPRDAPIITALKSTEATGGWVPMPAFPHTLSVKIAFTIGAGIVIEGDNPISLDLGTNLVGSVIGGALGALGAPAELKDYFAKNLAVGIALPIEKKHRIGSGYSLGLGSAAFKRRTIWPVLAIQQIDSSASDLPADLRTRDPTQAAWSVPYVGVAVTLHDRATVQAKLDKGELLPIFSLAVRLPYYYPGNAAAAFGALFTDNVAKYVSENSAVIVFGISVPLLRSDK